MTAAPEKIWVFAKDVPRNLITMGDTEYVRADVVDARVHAAHRAGYDLARDDAADNGTYLVTYDVMMKGVK